MRETQRNIKRYKEQMSHVKYKIASMAVMLVVSIAMLTTTSFAWLVLSVKPEVSNITTSIAGNGNLEIALGSSDEAGNLKYPDESTSSDGSITDLTIKNTTWGNLINLGDAAYGLHKITLKPASLYTSDLSNSPLAAIKYDKDGRAVGLDASGLKYSNFDPTVGGGEGAFVVSNHREYGVRAVSATRATNTEGILIKNKVNAIRNGNLQKVKDNYQTLIKNNITVVADLMGTVMEEQLMNSTKEYYSYLDDILRLMNGFLGCYEDTLDVYADIINMMIEQEKLNINGYTGDMILTSMYNADGSASGTPFNETYFKNLGLNKNKDYDMLDGLDEIITDYKRVKADMLDLQAKYDDPNVKTLSGDEVLVPVSYLVDIYSCKIDNDKTVSQLMGSMSQAMGLLDGGTHQGTITKGALVRFEQITGAKMNVTGQKISVSFLSIKANIDTAAKAPFNIDDDLGDLEKYLNNGVVLTETATDIYGMVIDFFLRTNAKDAKIILEGEPVTEQQVLTQKIDDKEYDVYEIDGTKYYFVPSVGTGYIGDRDLESKKLSQDEINYITDQASRTGKFVNYTTGQEYSGSVSELDFENSVRYALKTVVTGYDGANRVWEESTNLNDGNMSATQGKGSCYIFYPKSVTEREQMLKLLNGLKVVFLSEDSKILTTAQLNTKLAYESAGKVIVPLELTDYNTVTDNGVDVPIITELVQNETTFISAIVYIDGELVTNDLVDATTGVTGYLNLQFGTDVELNPMEDEDLKHQTIKVDGFFGSVENPTDTWSLKYGKESLSVNTYVNISGVNASKVTANFVRQLNTSQGVAANSVTFKQQENGVWVANATFDSPGDYILRSVWIDGVEYEFSNNKTLKVSIDGLSINNIWLDNNETTIYKMTSDNKFTTNTYVTFGANDAYVPTNVKALYVSGNNDVLTVTLNKNSEGQWSAPTTFTESGTYTLTTLVVDGDPIDIPEQLRKTIYLYLGIDVDVDLQSVGATYQGAPTSTTAYVKVFDKNGKQMNDLSNVYLRYNMSGSSINSAIAKVEWNAARGCYVGELSFKTPGIYEFYSLGINKTVVSGDSNLEDVVLSNYLYDASSESFSFLTTEAPKYVSEETEAYQFAPNKDGKFVLSISNSMAATGKATLVHKEDGKKFVVDNLHATKTEGSLSIWEIAIPEVSSEIKQNGSWELESLELTNVYVDGNMYMLNDSDTVHDYYDIKVPKIQAYVVNVVKVSLTNNSTAAFKTDVFTSSINEASATKDSGAYDFSRTNYKLTITDYYGVSVDSSKVTVNVTNLFYDYTLDANTKSWWTNYSSFINESGTSTYSYAFTNNAISRISFNYAGVYTPRLEISFNDTTTGKNYDYTISRGSNDNNGIGISKLNDTTADVLKVDSFVNIETIKWLRPNVKFTNVGYASNAQGSAGGTNSITADGKSATVWYKKKSSGSGCTASTDYYPAILELTVSNAGTYSSAVIPIDGDKQCGQRFGADVSFDTKTNKASMTVGETSRGATSANIKGDTLTVNGSYKFNVGELTIIMGDN